MEQAENINIKSSSFVNNSYRSIIFSVLSELEHDTLEIIEDNKHFLFPNSDKISENNAPNLNQIHAKIHIIDYSAYKDFVLDGSIGAAEAFIAGKWTTTDLTQVIRLFARAQKQLDALENDKSLINRIKHYLFHWRSRNSQKGSKKNILAHYDIGNELYSRFLDPEMMYSAAIYPTPETTLNEAQIHKLEAICQQLALNSSDHLLEIGTGWGGMAIYAAQRYGCKVTTTTISDAQHKYAQERINALGLDKQITLLKEDYRNLTGQFDKLVSIEMIEAVGYQYLPTFFKQCQACLKPNGLMLIQSITIADQRFDYYRKNIDFIQRYIFPGGFLPSICALTNNLTNHTTMVVQSITDIGLDYAKTLNHWRENFLAAWPELNQLGYDEKFKRLWLYYLAYCEGGFIERSISTVHFLARKN